MARFDNKIVLVTGAANGIGRCMVKCFLAEGAEKLVAVDIEHDTLEDAFGDDPGASVISEDDLWGGDVHGVHMGRTPMMRVSSLLKMAP